MRVRWVTAAVAGMVIGLVGLLGLLAWLEWRASLFHVEPAVEELAPDGATITWTTKDEVYGVVEYGTTEALGHRMPPPKPQFKHQVRLEGLQPDTTYYYRVTTADGSPSRLLTFKTLPAETAFYVEPYLQLPTTTGMTIMWETRAKLPGRIEYGPNLELGLSADEKAETRRLHQVRLEGLEAGKAYHYRVRSGDLVSKANVFRAAPTPDTRKWRMVVYGDSRSDPEIHRRVVEQIAKHNVDLIVHTGDIVASGSDHASWRDEFFVPLAPILGSVPWVSTIGNHEEDHENYFSYMALPGNERYFGFDYANAQIICLDSNSWMNLDGRDLKQKQWMEEHLRRPREATWSFVAFHHPLFSAHAYRPISSLRWDWTPLFLEPGCRIDAVFNGHDHFYARNHVMARVSDGPRPGVLFLTTAGGAAPLYPVKQRDYVARVEPIHHFTLCEFDGDQVTLSAIDTTGRIFDRHILRKTPTPPDELCAYEIEELRKNLREALAAAAPVEVAPGPVTTVNTSLEVRNPFGIPMKGTLRWKPEPGWKMKQMEAPFEARPGERLRIPLEAEVEAKALGTMPLLTIEFEPGRFRNRTVQVYPFKLTGPAGIPVEPIPGFDLASSLDGPAWERLTPLPLLATSAAAKPSRPGEVRLGSDGEYLYVSAKLIDQAGKVRVAAKDEDKEPSRLVLSSEHVRVELSDGEQTHQFAFSAEQIPYHTLNGKESPLRWPALAEAGDGYWTARMAIPLDLFPNRSKLRINVVHLHRAEGAKIEAQLRPGFALDLKNANADVLPAWVADNKPERFAQLVWK